MDDEKLINLVRNYTAIYDLSHPNYMNSNCKQDIWNKIGQEMEIDGLLCKARWNNIRDCYRKSLKKTATRIRSGQCAREIKIYKYSKQLSFLKKYVEEGESIGNIDFQEGEEKELEIHPSPCTKKLKLLPTKTVSPQKTASATLMEYLISKNENQANTASQIHPVDAFLAGVAPTLKKLTPYYLNLAKLELFTTVQKFEMKMLMEEQSYQGGPDVYHMTSHSNQSSDPSTPLQSPVIHFQENATFHDQNQSSSPSTVIPDN